MSIKSITIRENVTTDDTSNPSVSTGVGIGYKRVPVEVILSGAEPKATITPLLLNATGDGYNECESVIVSGAKSKLFTLDIFKSQNVNFRIDNISGTGTSVTIKVHKMDVK